MHNMAGDESCARYSVFPKPTQLAYIWGVLRDVSQNRSITGRNLFWILKMHRPSMNFTSTLSPCTCTVCCVSPYSPRPAGAITPTGEGPGEKFVNEELSSGLSINFATIVDIRKAIWKMPDFPSFDFSDWQHAIASVASNYCMRSHLTIFPATLVAIMCMQSSSPSPLQRTTTSNLVNRMFAKLA